MISILGCSGVGKSSVINELLKLADRSFLFYENISEIVEPISDISFSTPYDKFLTTQRKFIERDINSLNNLDPNLLNIFDNRLSEYVFYLLHHPDFLIYKNESYNKLQTQIEQVLNAQNLRSFYLTDDISNIQYRVKNDITRVRYSWKYFIEHMYPFHEKWHVEHGAMIINVKGRTSAEVAKEIYDTLQKPI